MKRRTAIVLLAVAAAFGMSACDTSVASSPSTYVFQVDGHPLNCVYMSSGGSCDWVRYHAEKGDLK